MSELEKALAAVGESAPERPMPEPIEGGDECDEVNSLANRLGLHVTALEFIALRLAVRLERAERALAAERPLCEGPDRCKTCDGYGSYILGGDVEVEHAVKCERCSGTGKEQGR